MKLTKRKLLAGIATVGASSIGGAGTYAYITDEDTARLSFQAGSIVLKISPKVIDFTSSTPSASSSEDNDQDDGDEMTTTITIENAGTLPVGQLELDGLTLNGAEDLKKGAEITTAEVTYPPDGPTEDVLSNWDDAVDDFNNNGIFDLADLDQHVNGSYIISLLLSDHTIPAFTNGQFKLTLGVTYDYEQVTTNGGTLSAELNYTARQEQ